ncbi:hypothetical protein LTR10_003718 [Elasticomyces elasticus]|nr:hypothetical protein LTR10_003718 [Elasticomyces elasticus]KAK4978090.1 hypothetical protein LTR42_002467 [Elasticomyces elasticus]
MRCNKYKHGQHVEWFSNVTGKLLGEVVDFNLNFLRMESFGNIPDVPSTQTAALDRRLQTLLFFQNAQSVAEGQRWGDQICIPTIMATIARLAGVPGTEGVGEEDEFPGHDEPSMKWRMLAAIAGTEHLLVKYEHLQTDTEIGVEDPLGLPARQARIKKMRAKRSTRAKVRTKFSKLLSRTSTRVTGRGRIDDNVHGSRSYVLSTRLPSLADDGYDTPADVPEDDQHIGHITPCHPRRRASDPLHGVNAENRRSDVANVDTRLASIRARTASPMRNPQRLPLTTATLNATTSGTPTPSQSAPRIVAPATPSKGRAIELDPRTPPAQIQSTTLPSFPSSSRYRARALPETPVSQGTRSAKKRKPVGSRSAEADFEGLKHILVPILWACKLLFAIPRAAFASPLETEAISQRRLNNILTHFGHLHETYGHDSAWGRDARADFQSLRREMVDIVHELWDNVGGIRERNNMFNAASPSIPRVSVLVRRLAGRLRVLDLNFARSITDRNEIVSSLGANLRGLQAISSITEENLHGWQIVPAESTD